MDIFLDILLKPPQPLMGLFLQTTEEREWFATRYEELLNEELSNEEKSSLAKLMLKSQVRSTIT